MGKKARKESTGRGEAKEPSQPKAKAATFQIAAPEANAVTVAGDFNQWDPGSNPLKKGKDGVWEATVKLKPGCYQYQFIVDGVEWREDPLNPNRVATPYGSFNSVREVG